MMLASSTGTQDGQPKSAAVVVTVSKRRKRLKPEDVKIKVSLWDYLRRIGLPLFLIALGVGLMVADAKLGLAGFFLCWVGAVLLALDIRTEIFFRNLKRPVRILIVLTYAGVLGIFSIWMFTAAPLMVTSESHVPAYPPDASVAGIRWEKPFSELRIQIKNDTRNDYSNVVIRVETDLGIEHLRAVENFVNCSSFPDIPPIAAPRITSRWTDEHGQVHETESVPSVEQDGPAWAYRVTCDKLPHNTEVDLVGAMSNQNLNIKVGEPLYLPARAARWVKIGATYDFRYPRTVDTTDCFVADCTDSLAPPSPFRHDVPTTIALLHKQADDSMVAELTVGVMIYAGLILLAPILIWTSGRFGTKTKVDGSKR